ncbi:MAG: TetR/AcrR family transcriptional regulator [Acidimicrobiales bacterium]
MSGGSVGQESTSRRGERRLRGRPPAGAEPVGQVEIMQAALDAFAAKGFDSMSVRDLNETLGVSHNYLHRRFGSKLDLWRAVVDHWIGGVDDELHAIADRATPGDDPLEVLHRVIVAFVTINCRQPALFRLVNTEASLPGERLDYLHDRYIGPSARGLAALVARLAPTGAFDSVAPTSLFFLLAHGATAPAAHGPLVAKLTGDELSSEAIDAHARWVADLVVDGLRPR